ncbi:B3 domain-containing protein REM10 [Euphorbia peplus]|nr:B3 domain-containing protein REM10 [Euphorbia peplus]
MSSTLVPKPLFFKPLLPGFHDDFVIPAAFSKYLKEQKYEKAMLGTRKGGKLWPVKINGRRFEDGWKEFVEAHGFQIGDFLVFRHEGDLVFHVLVFDRTTCEREYQCSPCFTAADVEVKIEVDDQEQEQEQEQEENLPEGSTCGEKLEENNEVKTSPKAKSSSFVFKYPYTVVQLNPKSIKKSRLHIPRKFARDHGLCGRCCSVILKNEEGNCWPANLLHENTTGKTYIAGGWTSFRVARTLTAEDSLIIELTRNGKIPVLKIQRLQAHPEIKQEIMNENRAEADSLSPVHLHATTGTSNLEKSRLQIPEEVAKQSGWKSKASSSSAIQKRFFVAKVTIWTTTLSKLYLPLKFSRLHFENRKSCKVILIDQEGRQWPAHLWNNNEKFQIADGWNEFQLANNLDAGDSFVFELIENGQKPVFKMCGVEANHKVASSSVEKPHFYLTVQISYLRTFQMKVPNKLASMSELAKSTAVIVTNEKGDSWRVLTRLDNDNKVFMTNGWTEFLEENGLEEGDVFMLELVKKGTTPQMKCYGKFSYPN